MWRRNPDEPLCDYCMTRVTIGGSALSFAANMAVEQNTLDYALKYPLAAKIVNESFYVDGALTGADTVDETIETHAIARSICSSWVSAS